MAQVLRKRVKRDPGLTHDFKPVTLQPAPLSGTPDHRPWGTNISYSHPKPPNGQEICISFFSLLLPPGKKLLPETQPDSQETTAWPGPPSARGSRAPFLLF